MLLLDGQAKSHGVLFSYVVSITRYIFCFRQGYGKKSNVYIDIDNSVGNLRPNGDASQY